MAASAQKRQRLILTHPEVSRRATSAIVATFAIVFVFFGVDFLDMAFHSAAGISVLSSLRRFLNESMTLRLLLLGGWGWIIFDFALSGGVALVTAPFHRFAHYLDNVPGKLVPFRLRGNDWEFRPIALSYNRMVDRILRSRDAILVALETAEKTGTPLPQVRREIEQFLESFASTAEETAALRNPARISQRRLWRLVRRTTAQQRRKQ